MSSKEILNNALECEKKVVRIVCHNVLKAPLYGEKLQDVVIFHLENYTKSLKLRFMRVDDSLKGELKRFLIFLGMESEDFTCTKDELVEAYLLMRSEDGKKK